MYSPSPNLGQLFSTVSSPSGSEERREQSMRQRVGGPLEGAQRVGGEERATKGRG